MQNTLREKIIRILTPPNPPDARFHGGVKSWEYKYNDGAVEYMVNEILSLIIEELPEEIEFEFDEDGIERSKHKDYSVSAGKGYNAYREELIKMLKGV